MEQEIKREGRKEWKGEIEETISGRERRKVGGGEGEIMWERRK